jgi:cytochrome c oxidase cbb3-type subunit 1
VPWLWKKKDLYSNKLVEAHFWLASIGIIFYILSLWFAGILEGLMWRAYTDLGFLEYSFIETVSAKHISYMVRAIGGTLYLTGALIMAFNIRMTIMGKGGAEAIIGEAPLERKPAAASQTPTLVAGE